MGLVGHEHEGETEKDESELFLDVALDLVEVHIVDLYLRVILEDSDSLLGIDRMQVNSNNLPVELFDGVSDGLKGSASAASDVEEVVGGEVHVVNDDEVGG